MQLKIAIAEDDKNNLRTIKMLCESEFFSVFTARDGKEMTDIIDEYMPEIIITDLIMPESHGIDVIRHARKKKHYSPIIIVISGLDTQQYIDLSFSAGADYFISKPVHKDSLRDLLRSIRQNKHIFA